MKNRYIPAILCAAIALCALTACADSASSANDNGSSSRQTTTSTTTEQTTGASPETTTAQIQPAPIGKVSGDIEGRIKWTIDEQGTLTVTGSGAIPDMDGGYDYWKQY
ncbi:MAG: hypothetical protein II168_05615, partial [Ruminococcus sp.]|nr:hypothetical protein [Ruminococcus sp.]